MKNNRSKLGACLGLLVAWAIFLSSVAIYHRSSFNQSFSPKLIKLYLRSQDIPDLPSNVQRVFLSDSQIYTAAGYLYAQGYSPTQYDFQHPPLMKYLFGFSIRLFNNPLYVQILMGLLLLTGVYLLGRRVSTQPLVGALAAIILAADPLLHDVTSQALLDLGQSVWLLFYVYFSLAKKPSGWLTGIFLGLASASKFWAGGLFFWLILTIYLLLTKQLRWQNKLSEIIVAALVFNLTYLTTYWQNWQFNNLYWQLKTLKYWFHHSVSSVPLASLNLFLNGFYLSWWQKGVWQFDKLFNPLWPTTFVAGLYICYQEWRRHKLLTPAILISALPILYLLYLGIQAPFSRYFIIILPYGYLALGRVILDNNPQT